jgi:hypothetical protein
MDDVEKWYVEAMRQRMTATADPTMPLEMPEGVSVALGRDERTARAVYRAIREALMMSGN